MFTPRLRAVAPGPCTLRVCCTRTAPRSARTMWIPESTSTRSLSAAAAAAQVEDERAPRVRAEDRPRPSETEVGARMRTVLRSVAQPVVVAVARTELGFHGATLTSFASLTLEPHPLVAFSLRLPSRMADLLRPRFEFGIRGARCAPIPLTVSLLAGTNQPIADALAKPGIDQAPIFAAPGWDASDPPALTDAVGALCCEVVHSVPLRDVGGDTASESAGSELFICKVVDATRGPAKDSLVHYQRDYYSVSSHEHDQ